MTNGQRIVYVLEDVSCDMEEPREKDNRLRALLMAAHTAALDSGTVAVGVVRALASQNINFKQQTFVPEGKTGRFRVSSVLKERDATVAALRQFVNRSEGAQGCSSDLLGALTAVERQHAEDVQQIGHDVKTDLLFVTNGLIVDRARKLILTKTALENPRVFASTLKQIRSRWAPPRLSGLTIWLVGTGWDKNIKSEDRGPAVRRLWAEILKPTGATVAIPVQSAKTLPPLLKVAPG